MSRTPPPALLAGPRCPLCFDGTVFDGYGHLCPSCEAWWGADADTGQWCEPDAPRCLSTCQPYQHAATTFGDALRPSIKALTWRCDLRSEHGEWHRTLHLPGLAWDDDGHAHTTLPDVPPLDTTTGVPCGCRRPERAEEVY